MHTRQDGLRAGAVLLALGVAALPSLNAAIAGGLLMFFAAWMASNYFLARNWRALPRSLRILHLGVSLQAVGTLARLVETAMSDGKLAVPSWADAVVIPGIVIMLGGMWEAGRARAAMARLGDVLDAVAMALIPIGVVVALTWEYFAAGSAPLSERLMNASLIVLDSVSISVLLVLIFGPGFRYAGAVWLAAGGLIGVLFDLTLTVGLARDSSWQDDPLRALALAITCYAIGTSYPEYITFGQPGTREQCYRSSLYIVGGLGLGLLAMAAASSSMGGELNAVLATMIAFIAVTAAKTHQASVAASRLSAVVAAEGRLAQALAQADTDQAAIAAANEVCSELLGSSNVEVALGPTAAPAVTKTERVWVGAWENVPAYLQVSFEQIAQVVEFSLDSIEARSERAAQAATRSATTDAITGLRTSTDFLASADPVEGVVASISCLDAIALARASDSSQAELVVQATSERLASILDDTKQPIRLWRGQGTTLIAKGKGQAWLHEALAMVLEAPMVIGAAAIDPTVAIGAVSLAEPTPAGPALERAKLALDQGERNTISWYSDELQVQARRQWAISSCFQKALRSPETSGFCVHYQGIVDATSTQPVAMEALVRWTHPTLGPISPAEFIPIAERDGLIEALDRWVLDTALEHLPQFRSIVPTIKMHVNMSPSGPIATKVRTLAHTLRLQNNPNANALVVELTESALGGQDLEQLAAACQLLRDLNVGLALDDFGTGESNFDRIAALPFTEIKLGAPFAASKDPRILKSIVPTIHNLGLPVVAENVETEEQLARLRAAQVESIQGWLFSRPSGLPSALRWLREHQQAAQPAISLE